MTNKSMRGRLLASSFICGAAMLAMSSVADAAAPTNVDELVITGTRIQVPGLQSASPVTSIGATELLFQQVPEVEQLLRNLPSTVPGDGGNVNNGTAGVATINLRGLGPERNLIMVDGKRLVPYNVNGRVDVSIIPTSMLQRVDVITGGASAVYGSDAISGAINFILKKNFEGVEANAEYSVTGEGDGKSYTVGTLMGANSADGRGNATLGLSYGKREPILLSARPYGILGVNTASGAGLGGSPTTPPADCNGPNTVSAGNGSGTSIPATIDLQTGDEFQFRNNGTLGATCSAFNFNPYNYYQTPNERYNALATAHYDITPHLTAYSQMVFASSQVRQQVAPSGVFFNTFEVPLANPYLSASARSTIITTLNAARAADPTLTLTGAGVIDTNGNGVVDGADSVLLDIGRRTLELGARSSTFSNDVYQLTVGLKGDISETWKWDFSYQHGHAKRSEVRAGYTNVVNIQNALKATNTTTCTNGVVTCVPLNLFGPYGSITPAQAGYAGATAIISSVYDQNIANGSINGTVAFLKSPWAKNAVAVAMGGEYREEFGATTPDECLKTPPTSCLGGAGGTTLPVHGGYSAKEVFGEAVVPLIEDVTFAKSVSLELGYRYADYTPSGANRSWKAGINWTPIEGLRFRAMQQRAVRVPNVGELAAPLATGLDNAQIDPCSVANVANIDATLRARCIATGQTPAQVGVATNISAGQIGVFTGTDPLNLPKPETGDTTTVGVVWQPTFMTFLKSPSFTVDYYKINIDNYIGTLPAQEILDGCYKQNIQSFCALIKRAPNGGLKTAGFGLLEYNTNLAYQAAEGVDVGANFGLDMTTLGLDQKWGSLAFSFSGNYYLANEFQSTSIGKVTECVGKFGTSCGGPTHEYRWQQRTVWTVGDVQLSYLWRHLSEVDIETAQVAKTFAAFRHIPAYDYIDLGASYNLNDATRITLTATNVFDKDPPIVGSSASTTSANSGNTLPRNYDALGRIFTVGVNLRF